MHAAASSRNFILGGGEVVATYLINDHWLKVTTKGKVREGDIPPQVWSVKPNYTGPIKLSIEGPKKF